MTDWEIRFDNSDLPMSCCRPQQGKIGTSVCNITVNYVYPDGCLNKFQQYIKSHAVQLGGVGLGIATIQVNCSISLEILYVVICLLEFNLM